MSRSIDFSKPLSAEDEAYAADRPWLREDAVLSGVIDSDGNPADVEESDEDDEDESYEDMTVDQLKDLLKERDLAVSGPKEALIQRLEEDDAANAE